MKKTALPIKTVLGILLLFQIYSCTKDDVKDVVDNSEKVKKNNTCDLAEFNSLNKDQVPLAPYIFHKKYDKGGNISQIDIGMYSGGVIYQRVILNVFYSGNNIFFVNNANAADTCLKASLNSFGKPATASFSTTIDFGLPDHRFYYDAYGHLSRIVIDEESDFGFWFHYDSRGNNTVISQDTIDGPPGILETFDYDITQSASQQLYLDYARGFSEDGFLIFHAMGLLPELNPVSVRTHTRVMWGSYQAYDADLFNHKIDPHGKLLGYDVGLHSTAWASWGLVWQCNTQED